MIKKCLKIKIIIPAVIITVGMMCFYFQVFDKNKISSFKGGVYQRVVINALYNKTLLPLAIEHNKLIKLEKNNQYNNVIAGISPHHDLASEMIADFFSSLPKNIETFIILAPNHRDTGKSAAVTGNIVWQTPFGEVSNNNQIINEMYLAGLIEFDNENFQIEHSISTLTPFIKYYYPKASIVPIIFTSKFDFQKSKEFVEKLHSYLIKNNIFLIASLDFSHYLTKDIANENDKYTLELIEKFDLQKLKELNNDYLDSPQTIVVFLESIKMLFNIKSKVLYHSNSNDILGSNFDKTTGYYTIIYERL